MKIKNVTDTSSDSVRPAAKLHADAWGATSLLRAYPTFCTKSCAHGMRQQKSHDLNILPHSNTTQYILYTFFCHLFLFFGSLISLPLFNRHYSFQWLEPFQLALMFHPCSYPSFYYKSIAADVDTLSLIYLHLDTIL